MRYSTALFGVGAVLFLVPLAGTYVIGAAVLGIGVLVRLFGS